MPKTIKAWVKIFIILTFFVPLIVIPNGYIFPFIVPKILMFRALSLLMLGGYVLLLLSHWDEYRPRWTLPNVLVLLFFVSFAVSTFVGVDWYRSFWDNHERMLGLFTLFHYVLYYFIVTSVIKEWREWRWLLRVFLLAGAMVMVIGLLQKIHPELLVNQGNNRVQSTLGNSIYVGGYGLFLAFLGYLLFIKEEVKAWKYLGLAGTALGISGIFASGTRGAFIALMFGVFVLFVSYMVSLKNVKKIKQTLGGIMLLGAVAFGFLFAFRQTDFVMGIPAVGRLVNTRISRGDTRIMAWEVALASWAERPIFGWGPNNYYFAFNEHYRPEFLEHGWGETWFDNAHNVLVNTLAVQGTVGIVMYVALFGGCVVVLWRRHRAGYLDAHMTSIGTAFLLAHFVSLVFVFENPTSYLYFFFYLAFLNSMTLNSARTPGVQSAKNVRRVSMGSIVVALLVVLLFIYSTDVKPARANKTALLALRAARDGFITQSLDLYRKAVSYGSPHVDDIRNDYARSAGDLVGVRMQNKTMDEPVAELLAVAHDNLQKNYELHPRDIRIHMLDAQLSSARAQIFQEPERLAYARDVLLQAQSYSPKRQQVLYMLSVAYLRLGEHEQAVQAIQQSIDHDPNIAEGWWRLALIFEDAGDSARAAETIQRAYAQEIRFPEAMQEDLDRIMSAGGDAVSGTPAS